MKKNKTLGQKKEKERKKNNKNKGQKKNNKKENEEGKEESREGKALNAKEQNRLHVQLAGSRCIELNPSN